MAGTSSFHSSCEYNMEYHMLQENIIQSQMPILINTIVTAISCYVLLVGGQVRASTPIILVSFPPFFFSFFVFNTFDVCTV